MLYVPLISWPMSLYSAYLKATFSSIYLADSIEWSPLRIQSVFLFNPLKTDLLLVKGQLYLLSFSIIFPL